MITFFSLLSSESSSSIDAEGEDDLTPGRSLVFGVMEICMCILTKQLPNLLPSSAASSQQPVMLVSIGSGFRCEFSQESIDIDDKYSFICYKLWTEKDLNS